MSDNTKWIVVTFIALIASGSGASYWIKIFNSDQGEALDNDIASKDVVAPNCLLKK